MEQNLKEIVIESLKCIQNERLYLTEKISSRSDALLVDFRCLASNDKVYFLRLNSSQTIPYNSDSEEFQVRGEFCCNEVNPDSALKKELSELSYQIKSFVHKCIYKELTKTPSPRGLKFIVGESNVVINDQKPLHVETLTKKESLPFLTDRVRDFLTNLKNKSSNNSSKKLFKINIEANKDGFYLERLLRDFLKYNYSFDVKKGLTLSFEGLTEEQYLELINGLRDFNFTV